MCVNGAWGSVCDSQGVFTTEEAKVACKQMEKQQVEGLRSPICFFANLLVSSLLHR